VVSAGDSGIGQRAGRVPYDAAKHRVLEGEIKRLGEVADLKPGASATLKRRPEPGDYLLIYNEKAYYAAGMTTPFSVTRN